MQASSLTYNEKMLANYVPVYVMLPVSLNQILYTKLFLFFTDTI